MGGGAAPASHGLGGPVPRHPKGTGVCTWSRTEKLLCLCFLGTHWKLYSDIFWDLVWVTSGGRSWSQDVIFHLENLGRSSKCLLSSCDPTRVAQVTFIFQRLQRPFEYLAPKWPLCYFPRGFAPITSPYLRAAVTFPRFAQIQGSPGNRISCQVVVQLSCFLEFMS
ncbi:macrophage immunometabolism regulator isoform X2 [Macaca nemestrina]|uniref:macrophage immunometabolism regulator isoform X2 n=1 Tax=Macaca nemestrina TaxID=9545 RepID=UPI0039B88B60